MDFHSWLELFVFILVLGGLIYAGGIYLVKVFDRSADTAAERWIYRLCLIDPRTQMTAYQYGMNLLWFNLFGFGTVFLLQLFQAYLPWNPQNLPNVPVPLAFNTAMSFTTNTNWQAYAGETTLSYFTQMAGLTVQNFLSAASGFAVLLALIRGIRSELHSTIGNVWVDLTRSVLYVLLPLSIILSLGLVSQGVIQNLHPYTTVTTLEGASQTLPQGPAASQIAIKQLGTNGGGFFNTNSAHPYENPTPLSNFLQTLAILIIPAASVYMYGLMTDAKRHALTLLAVMATLWGVALILAISSEFQLNPSIGNVAYLEGKEVRFGILDSLLWAISTTATSNGSVNAMMDSLSPLSGGLALSNILLGEIIIGGVGVGLIGMVMFVLLTVFLCGLMIGRTPEYLGKKIRKNEIQWVMFAVLTPAALILIGSGISIYLPSATEALTNKGPHGLSELAYAFASGAGNNGSAFGGLDANRDYFNWSLGFVMLMGRLAILFPGIAVAGLFAEQKKVPPSSGTLPLDTLMFGVLVLFIIVIVGSLTFLPMLTLGPIVEIFLNRDGQVF
jgi:K+-transporting ATPase ATPase A chain